MRDVILPRITVFTDQDYLHDMIVCCYEVLRERRSFSKALAVKKIEAMAKQRNREKYTLYNPYRNISLNQSTGDSNVPASDWMNLSGWREWD